MMESLPYRDFRGFIEEAKKISEWRLIEGADWDNEIGALIESTAELDSRPMLLFDKIKGYHDGDGGRYIGTGNCRINADPESGFINAGTYRMQLHDRDLLGLWMSPGQHGRLICAKYWEQGKSCPVVVA